MATGNIHIGTSGWSYKHWRDIYYPPKMKPADYLPYYAETFGVAEINNSFYRLPTAETVVHWSEQVPAHFRFCPKMSRYLTQMKKLRDPEEPLERFFTVFAPIGPMLGPVLIQLPPQLPFNYDRAAYFYGLLLHHYNAYDFAVEIRHPSWLDDASLDLMAQHRIAFVISQSGGPFPYAEIVTAIPIYVRLHGPAELYASPYSEEQLRYYAEKFQAWSAEGHAIWAFFNNDIHGYAFQDAQRLKAMLG